MTAGDAWPSVLVEGELRRARGEWLHTNGAGAYASSTIAGMHTRRYHGLLVAALDPPRGRHVFLSHVDATVTLRRALGVTARPPSRPRWELAKHQFPRVDPESTPFHLDRFDQDPLPRWTYRVAGGSLEVTLALVRGENAVVLRYAFTGPEPVVLTLRPLLAARGFHALQREHGGMVQRVELRAGEMRVQPRRELPRVCFRYEGTFVGSPDWWRRFEYLAERDRGLDFEEDLWTPGVFEIPLGDAPAYLVAAVDKLPEGDPPALLEAAKNALIAEDPGPSSSPLARRLALAVDAFRADLARRPGVIAGYPWFEVWLRDALLALPGVYLVPKKIDGALRILREAIGAMIDGVVPNRIPEAGGAPEMASADTTLWLFEAARHVADVLGERHSFVTDELLLALRDAFEAALAGAKNGTWITPEGLFAASAGYDGAASGPKPRAAPGGAGHPLTWMDAVVDGRPVTLRAGCPVELTALWARGCDTLARFARAAGDAALSARAAAERDRARRGFHERFWCEETGYPFDVVAAAAGEANDASVRPNAVLALSVDPACFTPERADAVLAVARRDLVTPAGLRTLAPSDPRFVGRYTGAVAARDGAYHQGSVWPWLVGPYVRAAVRRGADRAELASILASAANNALALGHVPELADGDAPHAPGGCVARAIGAAELLRAIAWDLA
jgi:glycogen debranching enzyme